MSFLTPFMHHYPKEDESFFFEHHFDVETDKAWEICKDYIAFLKVMIVAPSKLTEEPRWIKGGPGKVGSTVAYTLSMPGPFGVTKTYIEETIVRLEETGSGYVLEWKQDKSEPALPMQNYHCAWELFRQKEGKRTYLKWTRYLRPPYLFGCISLLDMFKSMFANALHGIFSSFERYYARKYPKRLPGVKDRVLIVGAGPSGLHMAHLLKQRGYKNITIMEKESRWGGKTYTIQEGRSENFETQLVGIDTPPGPDTVYHELGTCYLHPAYFAVRALFEELKKKGCTQTFEEVGPESYTIYREGLGELGFEEWITSTVQVQPTFSPFNLIRILFPFQDMEGEVLVAKGKYNTLHEAIFGKYNYSMPPPLSTDSQHLLDMSFGEFLEKHDLSVLLPILAYGNTCQGYGSIAETPAFWAMCWITPELLNGYFAVVPEYPKKTMLKQGWISLWNAIVQVNELKIRFNTTIKKIVRTPEGKVIVTGTQGEIIHKDFFPKGVEPGDFEEEYDFLVMGAPAVDGNGESFLDLTEEEREIFTRNVEHGQFRTALFSPRETQPYLKSHLGIYANRVIGSAVGEGEVFAWRDSYLALHPARCFNEDDSFPDSVTRPEDGIYHQNDPKRDQRREQMAYQYVENSKNYSEEFLREKFRAWAHTRFGGQFDLLHEKTWDYFTRFNSLGIRQRDPWKLLSMQGTNKTLFVHASSFFESVLDIVNYNNMLLDGLSGEFNQLVPAHPASDHKPPYAPVPVINPKDINFTERLLGGVTRAWETVKSVTTSVIFRTATPVLNVLWTLTYLVTFPLLRLVVFPLQRYRVQAAFRTANISIFSIWSLNHFIRISPSAVCLETGNEDAIVTMVYNEGDASNFPGIKRPRYAINWNYQDYRVMIREWFRVNEPTYLSFITPKVANWIRTFARWSPRLYNYIFSWLAITNFSYLTGYSYRKEDKDGGGAYVPKCEMLAASKKLYGQEKGERVCTHVCKIFTEEYLKTKGMNVTFQPNFDNGSCTIRGKATPSTCFSDNVLYEW